MAEIFPLLTERRAALNSATLPLPEHVTTPTGQWSFLKGLEFLSVTEKKGGEARSASSHSVFYEAPDGIEVTEFKDLSGEDATLVMERLMTLVPPTDRLAAQHLLALTEGVLIRVTRPVFKPLFLKHAISGKSACHTLIILEQGAQAKIVEKFTGAGSVSHVTEAFLREKSHLLHAELQEVEGEFLSRKAASVARDASADWFELAANEGLTFSRIGSSLDGENASTGIATIYLGDAASRVDVGAKAEHRAPHGTSSLLTKGVLDGEAKGIYEGVLSIGKDAAKSEAFQQEHCLLLSEQAEIKASPLLYIDNNDVKCSHAATAGKPDAEKLFYLMARGLSQQDARRLLIKAFVWPVVEAVPEYSRGILAPIAERAIDRFVSREVER